MRGSVTNRLLADFDSAIRKAQDVPDEDPWFRTNGVVYMQGRGGGFYVWINRHRMVFDAGAEAILDKVVGSLASEPPWRGRIGKDLIRELVYEAAASAAAMLADGRTVDMRSTLEGILSD